MKAQKILISGYYGFDNFGDDAILHVLISDIKKNLSNSEITVISNNPDKTSKDYNVNSIHRFDFKKIISMMADSTLFISGGGSLLQDVTSLKSLIYYLALIFLAKIFRVKTCVYAQGIGPIRNKFGKILTSAILKKVDLITVRDQNSQDFLKNIGVKSTITTDPAWGLQKDSISSEKNLDAGNKIKVGIQLRSWKNLDKEKLEILADVLVSNFNLQEYQLVLFSLQDSMDLSVTKTLKEILNSKKPNLNIKLISGLSTFKALSLISRLDYLVAMRYHACLAAIKFGIPTLALSYDPKVENLSAEAQIPYIPVDKLNKQELGEKISELITNRQNYINKLEKFSLLKEVESRQNFVFLVKMLLH